LALAGKNLLMIAEIHLFIFWEKARYKESKLLDIVESKFTIIQTFSITWSPYNVGRNFTRFYGQNLPDNSEKELHCGGGAFKVVVVRDENPIYQFRDTSKGKRKVNINTFDAKVGLREITGGGHKIHGTDSVSETKHSIALLFGLSLEEFLTRHKGKVEDVELQQDLIGTNGWNSFNELFHVLNQCSDYVVMRNHENINLEYFKNSTGDIDLLSKDATETKYILGDLKNILNEHLKVDVNKAVILFEVYQANENLFDKKWEQNIFKSKQNSKTIYHPNVINEMYMLIYHALFFKRNLEKKHIDTIQNKYQHIFNGKKSTEKEIICALKNFLNDKRYAILPPDNGYFNFRDDFNEFYNENKKRKSKWGRAWKKVISISYRHKYISINFLMPVRKLLVAEITIPYLWKIVVTVGS
jgi:hypothetical protein